MIYTLVKEENFDASIIGLKKAMFFKDADAIIRSSDMALANLVPWYGERIKKRKVLEQQKVLRDLEVADKFEKMMET